MARKRAPGAGRKPKGEFVGKTATLTTRITPATRRALEQAAKASGNSLSQEIERRLRAAIQKPAGAPHNRALAHAIAVLAEGVEQKTHRSWRDDSFTGIALRYAVEAFLFHFAPIADAAADIPPAIEEAAAKMPSELAERYRKPAGFGHMRALSLVNEIEQAAPSKIDEWTLPMFFNAPVEVLGLINRDLGGESKS